MNCSSYADGHDSLAPLEDCHTTYSLRNDTNRRLCNQAFFEKIYVDKNNELRAELAQPFDVLFEASVTAGTGGLSLPHGSKPVEEN